MPGFVDLTGSSFGKLTVLKRSEESAKNGVKWVCQCDCGNVTIVRGNDMKMGKTLSCGCTKKSGTHRSHSKTGTRLYRIWGNVKTRCTNKNIKQYKDYGGKGITICDEWKDSFEAFYEWAMSNGYSDELTIDRIDANGNYEPSNCRWATRREQALNRTDNHYLTYGGETKTLVEWSEITGLNPTTITSRIQLGFSIEEALTKAP